MTFWLFAAAVAVYALAFAAGIRAQQAGRYGEMAALAFFGFCLSAGLALWALARAL